MSRALVRMSVLVTLALTFAVLAVPAAHARPAATPTVATADSGWLTSAWSWLSYMMLGQKPAVTARHGVTAKSALLPPNETGQHGERPQSGSCIDPMGHVVFPCFFNPS